MRFAQEYIASVLNENFEDAKALFLEPLMSMHYAHLVMLAAQGIVEAADARAIRAALDTIPVAAVRKVAYDGTFEDLFFYVNRLIEGACGPDVAGRLHTARSRNDIGVTLYRMRQRERVLALLRATIALRTSLIAVADRHRDTIVALHTHTQPAQPSTVAHYLLAVIEQLERDAARLRAAFAGTNRCPLGACAITGTGFPIDRQLTSDLLGFDGPTGNTYGSIAAVDYLLENVGAAANTLVGVGRFVQDLLLWSTMEFAYLRLADGFVQGSSIMPQKRNPVALEHARALCSRAFGEATGVQVAVHNTPFGDIVDTEDDLQPLVDRVFVDAVRAVSLVAAALAGADFDVARLEARAGEAWITITELADTLVRDHGLPFDAAHAVARRVVQAREADPAARLSDVVEAASRDLTGRRIRFSEEALTSILLPRHFVDARRTPGGPAPAEIARAMDAAQARLASDLAWVAETVGRLDGAAATLRERSARL